MKYNDSLSFENLQNRAVALKTLWTMNVVGCVWCVLVYILWAVRFVLCILGFVELDYVCCGLCLLCIVYTVSCVCSGLCVLRLCTVGCVCCGLCLLWTVYTVSCAL